MIKKYLILVTYLSSVQTNDNVFSVCLELIQFNMLVCLYGLSLIESTPQSQHIGGSNEQDEAVVCLQHALPAVLLEY